MKLKNSTHSVTNLHQNIKTQEEVLDAHLAMYMAEFSVFSMYIFEVSLCKENVEICLL